MKNGLIIDIYGNKHWYKNDLKHREDGPAFESSNGYRAWWINGKRHREDGPAMEYSDGTKYWYFNGKYIECSSNEEFLRIIKLRALW